MDIIRRLRPRSLVILALCAITIASAGCRRRAADTVEYSDPHPLPAEPLIRQLPAVGRYGGRFVLGQTANPKTFNGMMATETSSSDVTTLTDAALVRFENASQQFTPELATSWEVAADGITWTFHLRKGAAFSDGHPITAEDVLFSFQVAYDDTLHPSAQDSLKAGGEKFRVSAPDAHTVVINTLKPNSALLDALCQGGLPIIPKHILEKPYKDGNFASAYNVGTPPDQLVTGGAWRVGQYVPGEKTVLARNPHYYGFDQNNRRLPYLNEVVFLIVPDQDAADLKFRSGELDGLDNVKPENYRWYEDNQRDGNFTLHDLGPGLNSNFIWFNLNRDQRTGAPSVDPLKYAWFNNRTFRHAVSMAIDRDAMIPSIFFGNGEKSWSLASRGNREWYVPDLLNRDYNLGEARKLLAGLGWKDSNGDGVIEDKRGNAIAFSIKTNADNTLRVAMANFIKDDLAKVGIRVTLAPVDFNTLITNIRSDFQYDSILLGLQSGVPPTPGNGQNVWRSSGETHFWFPRQRKPATPEEGRIDQLMDVILTSQDRAVQKEAFKEIQTIMNEQGWFIWLPILKVKLPVSNRFGNVQPSIMAHRLLWNAERIFVKPVER
ncbi:MAG TPA: ABC transporter substrate-binding protein [Vicinamibacterales bacterium]|nr:ABC transporter substrate-binding protein [Vicinamibacterales bacterium]